MNERAENRRVLIFGVKFMCVCVLKICGFLHASKRYNNTSHFNMNEGTWITAGISVGIGVLGAYYASRLATLITKNHGHEGMSKYCYFCFR
jgi:hypothetical protein